MDDDDGDPSSTVRADDGDCDGVLPPRDCDDANPSIGSSFDDSDCDGVPTGDDCDDEDPEYDPGVGPRL